MRAAALSTWTVPVDMVQAITSLQASMAAEAEANYLLERDNVIPNQRKRTEVLLSSG